MENEQNQFFLKNYKKRTKCSWTIKKWNLHERWKTKWKKHRRRSSLLTRETPFQFSKWREKSSPVGFNFSVLSANPKLNSEPVALKQLKNKPSVQARFTTVPFKSVLEKKRRRYEEEKTTKICSQNNMTERRN